MAVEPTESRRIAPPAGGLIKHSLAIAGHRTSVSLEPRFWECLKEAAAARGVTVPRLIAEIDSRRANAANLSSAIRVYLLEDALALRGSDRG